MTVHADEFRGVPGQEVSGCLPDECWIREGAETDWTTRSLVAEGPAKSKEADAKGCGHLEVLDVERASERE